MEKSFISLASLILGFILAQFTDLIKYNWKKRNEKISIILLLNLEISRNKEIIEEYWSDINSPLRFKNDDSHLIKKEPKVLVLIKRVCILPFPKLSNFCWEGNITKLPEYIKSEKIQKAWTYYDYLSRLSILHSTLLIMQKDPKWMDEDKEIFERSPAYLKIHKVDMVGFKNKSASIMHEFESIISILISEKFIV